MSDKEKDTKPKKLTKEDKEKQISEKNCLL